MSTQDMPLWYRSRLYTAALAQLGQVVGKQQEDVSASVYQLEDGTYWCRKHDCSAYECACAWHE